MRRFDILASVVRAPQIRMKSPLEEPLSTPVCVAIQGA